MTLPIPLRCRQSSPQHCPRVGESMATSCRSLYQRHTRNSPQTSDPTRGTELERLDDGVDRYVCIASALYCTNFGVVAPDRGGQRHDEGGSGHSPDRHGRVACSFPRYTYRTLRRVGAACLATAPKHRHLRWFLRRSVSTRRSCRRPQSGSSSRHRCLGDRACSGRESEKETRESADS